MSEVHTGLELFRDQLRDAVARDLARTPPRLPRSARFMLPTAAAAATGAALVLTITGGAPAPIAQAAVMRHVTAALTAPPATILHERALVTRASSTQPYELWVSSVPPHAYRVIKWGHEGTGTGGGSADPAAALRSLVASGGARVAATTTFNGTPAYKLSVTGGSDRWLDGTVYVSRADYHPLQIEAGGERIVFQTYEYLPATSSNLQLLK